MSRALSSVLGVVVLAAVTVVAATLVGALGTIEPGGVAPTARLSVSADADAGRITLTHQRGDTLAVEDLSLRVRIDGEPLRFQPPVPFFAAYGFESGPTGPFNVASDDDWTAGERATLRLAGTNDPPLEAGTRVEVTVATDAGVVTTVETTAG